MVRLFRDVALQPSEDIIGIVALGKYSPQQMAQIATYQLPVCYVDCDTLAQGYNCVVADFEGAVQQVLAYYHKEGIERIAFLGGRELYSDGSQAPVDVRQTLFEVLAQPAPTDVLVGSFSVKSGKQLMRDYLAQEQPGARAFFVASDGMAIGAIQAVKEAGLKVPEDIRIIGFNDISTARYLEPALSTVRVYTQQMGAMGVQVLLNGDQQGVSPEETVAQKVIVQTKLIVRAS